MKKFKKTLAVFTVVLILLCVLLASAFAEGDIPIDEAHFPRETNFPVCVLADYPDEHIRCDLGFIGFGEFPASLIQCSYTRKFGSYSPSHCLEVQQLFSVPPLKKAL